MRLTHESPRARWLILLGTWVIVAGCAAWHSRLIGDYVAQLDRLAERSPPAVTPLHRPCLSNFMDAMMWTRYALALQEGAPAQVHHTDIDNAPAGRDVHWNSALTHALAWAGRLEQWRAGGTLPEATERALGWFTFPLLMGAVILFSSLAARWAGAGAGVIVALGMLGSHDFYEGFMPNYVDHHGLLAAAVFGVMLGAVFMGGGWWNSKGGATLELLPASREHVRRGAILSAACGAVGMWISAATVIPAIVIAGAAAVLTAWWSGRDLRAVGAEFDPGAWRLWGRVGAALSVGFYLLEYAPSHLGLRLEVNHPLHALAWWGGAELITWSCEFRLAASNTRPAVRRLLWPVLALAVTPVTILALGTKVFVATDPFVAQLSASVAEGISQIDSVRILGWSEFRMHFNTQLLPLALAAGLLARGRRADRSLLIFATGAALMFVAMACWKIRWWLNAGGPLVCVLLVALAWLARGRTTRWRWLAIALAGLVCYGPDAIDRFGKVRGLLAQRASQPVDIMQPLYRDVAATLRATQPQGEIVLLASPNTSAGVGYYGRFKTLGTLYWENIAGLRAAAEIFSAGTDAEAFALLRARGVTHLAMISEQNYLAEYFQLLRPTATATDFEKTFGARILYQFRLPLWLQAIPYTIPGDVRLPNLVVRLFRVVPEQTVAEAYWHLGEAELAEGEFADGEAKFQRAIAELPANIQNPQRVIAGNACYQYGAHAAAARFYRAVLAAGETPAVQRSLAWVLSTSPVDAVRDGRAALALVERLAATQPRDATLESIIAATLAENGRFAEAVAAATRALEGARAAGDQTAEALNAKRLETYRAGRPWRQ